MVLVALSLEVKQLRPEADHSAPAIAEVNTGTTVPCAFMVQYLIN
jgi:hypothetical protein